VALRERQTARPGDLVKACRNAREEITNGEIWRIHAVTGDRVTVVRAEGHDRDTGQREWSEPFTVAAAYLAEHADLGYAQTIHTIQGATKWTGITLTSDKRTRTSLYPGATRGRTANHIFAYPAEADCEPATHPCGDPEAERARVLEAERAGNVAERVSDIDPLSLLAPVVRRDGKDLSATETLRMEALNADHMARLWTMRQDVTREESALRFRQAVRAVLPAVDAERVLGDTDDLYRALRAAEIAGLDAEETLTSAVAGRETGSANSLAAVLAHRVRGIADPLPPQPRQPLRTADPELAAFAAWLDDRMAEREFRIGEHSAATSPLWAVRALGPVPDDEAGRAEWQERAGKLGAWREIDGRDNEPDALGSRPPTTFPEKRAEWQRAADVTPRIDGMDLRDLTEGQLLTRRAALPRETAWAPPDVGHELGAACRAADAYRLQAARHLQLAGTAPDPAMVTLHQRTAEAASAAASRAREVAGIRAGVHEARREHTSLTAETIRVARATDTELWRRGLLTDADKLESREPRAFDYERDDDMPPDEATVRKMLGLNAENATAAVPDRLTELSLIASSAMEKIDQIRTMAAPEGEGDEELTPSEAWSKVIGRQRQSVLQPAEPPMAISPRVAKHMAKRRDADREAG
jgi:hypothetical protein